MTLERLIAEIQSRAADDLAAATAQHAAERDRLTAERDRRAAQIAGELDRQAAAEARRELAQRVAGARMQARKLEYESRERALGASLGSVRAMLADLTEREEYDELLRRMREYAASVLGREVRISGRAEDAARLKRLAGRSFVPTPQPILGGLIAESPDGARRLTLSFDELLRLREDRVRELLA
jgi:vacuolar-type H+-ATPase subunit E/Vma4